MKWLYRSLILDYIGIRFLYGFLSSCEFFRLTWLRCFYALLWFPDVLNGTIFLQIRPIPSLDRRVPVLPAWKTSTRKLSTAWHSTTFMLVNQVWFKDWMALEVGYNPRIDTFVHSVRMEHCILCLCCVGSWLLCIVPEPRQCMTRAVDGVGSGLFIWCMDLGNYWVPQCSATFIEYSAVLGWTVFTFLLIKWKS